MAKFVVTLMVLLILVTAVPACEGLDQDCFIKCSGKCFGQTHAACVIGCLVRCKSSEPSHSCIRSCAKSMVAVTNFAPGMFSLCL